MSGSLPCSLSVIVPKNKFCVIFLKWRTGNDRHYAFANIGVNLRLETRQYLLFEEAQVRGLERVVQRRGGEQAGAGERGQRDREHRPQVLAADALLETRTEGAIG